MGNWFPAKGRGLVFGIWTCHQYIGDITAALASGYLLHSGYDYRLCIIIPAIVNGVWALINFFQVPNTPEEYGIETEASKKQQADKAQGVAVVEKVNTLIK